MRLRPFLSLLPVLTVLAACAGDPDTTSSTQGATSDASTASSTTADATDSASTTDAGTISSTTATTDATTDATTTATTATTTDATTDDTSTTAPDLPAGQCWSEFHGAYWCECTEGNTQACGDDGVSVCFLYSATVITHMKWGPCGACEPGQQEACDVDGAPGRRFCDVSSPWVADIDDLPTPEWGVCLLEDDIACEPGASMLCDDGVFYQSCEVDEQGVPYWTEC